MTESSFPGITNPNSLEAYQGGRSELGPQSLQALGSLLKGSRFPRGLVHIIRTQRRIDIRNIPVVWYWRVNRDQSHVHPLRHVASNRDLVYYPPVPAHIYIKESGGRRFNRGGEDDEKKAEYGVSLAESIRLGTVFGLPQFEPLLLQPEDVVQRGGVLWTITIFDDDAYYANTRQVVTWKGNMTLLRADAGVPDAADLEDGVQPPEHSPYVKPETPEVPVWPVP